MVTELAHWGNFGHTRAARREMGGEDGLGGVGEGLGAVRRGGLGGCEGRSCGFGVVIGVVGGRVGG